MTPHWPDALDEILAGDQAVVLAHVTPARGVVLTPLTNFGLRNRDTGTVASVNSSIGMWRKLERIQRDPRVALAFHTREHGLSDRPEYVLVQGRASLSSLADRDWLRSIRAEWERVGGQPRDLGPLWERWLRVYHWRVGIEVATERVIGWPDLACNGVPEVHGAPLPAEAAPPQRPPARGTSPRIDHAAAAARAGRLPNLLVGWVGADGLPVVVPVEVAGITERGILLDAREGLLPPGGRRAGLTAHWFARHVIGQTQRIHTGWLASEPGGRNAVYAPHTEAGYRLPPSKLLYRLGAGFVTRRGLREARRAGFVPR